MFYVEEIATYPTVNFSCDYFCFKKGKCGYFGLSFKKRKERKKKSLPNNNISQNRKLLNRINRFINKVLFSSFPLSGSSKDKRQVYGTVSNLLVPRGLLFAKTLFSEQKYLLDNHSLIFLS